ncbi:hypothetical protein EC991_005603 [Linnemannia zychae]|nr:hypothetical protein EC991_005603 [Linnemannia zychae]
MSNAIVTFFSIPELTSELCLYLTTADFRNLIQTNRHIHNACRPHFWNTLLLRNDVVTRRFIDPVANEKGLESFGKNIDYVRTLQMKGRFISFYAVGLCKYLDNQNRSPTNSDSVISTLEFEHRHQKQAIRRPDWVPFAIVEETENAPALPPFRHLTDFQASTLGGHIESWERSEGRSILTATSLSLQICWIMSLNPNLTNVFLHGADLANARVVRCLARTISSLHHLKDLAIRPGRETYTCLDVVDIIFRSCPQSLVSFKMSTDTSERSARSAPFDLGDNDVDAGQVVLRTGPLINLRVLQLPDNYDGYSAEEICHFLEQCPQLETWHLPTISNSAVVETITKAIRTHCKRIKRLLDGRSFAKDVLGVMENQQLERLECYGVREEWPGQIMSLLIRHSEVLQKLRLRGCGSMESSAIHIVLTSCRELRYLEIESHSPNQVAMSMEDAGSAKEWVCKKLRYLTLCVAVPPTSMGLEKLPWGPLEQFYRHLGTLHELEFLDLKGVGYYPYTREDGRVEDAEIEYDRLSFPGLLSLGDPNIGEPGYLSLLKDLRRLTSFQGSLSWQSMRNEEPRGRREMEWVVEHWPSLKMFEIMHHLHRYGAEHRYPYLGWLCEQMPQLVLCKPHVQLSCGHGRLKYSW